MEQTEIQKQWDNAAYGWAKWENVIAEWFNPATDTMFNMAGISAGSYVLDIACGAGNQTLKAARLTGKNGNITACDISGTMLQYLREKAQASHLDNISTILGAAEELNLPAEEFDVTICHLGLMLFSQPAKALTTVKQALKPGGRFAAVVFTTPQNNNFMAKPMEVMLRHAEKKPPAPGQPGIFSLGAPGVLKNLLIESGFENYNEKIISISLKMPSIEKTLEMMKEAFGAYRAVIADCSESVRAEAWKNVMKILYEFETEKGFEAPAEVLVAGCVKL